MPLKRQLFDELLKQKESLKPKSYHLLYHIKQMNCGAEFARGGGYLVYLSDGDVTFFRVSFSPIFSTTGYQKKANFLEQVVKTCQKRKFCYNG